jgi:adenosylhomocysteine nucleosidase
VSRVIGLIAAMDLESRALRQAMPGWKRAGPGSVRRLELPGRACLLATSGMGVRRAGEVARQLIETHGARLLVSFGIAGAIEPDLEIGDAVLPAHFCALVRGRLSPPRPLAAWPPETQQTMSAALTGRRARLFIGTAVTTAGEQLVPAAPGKMAHPILEMETAGIAAAAAEAGVPLLALRTISDGPRAPIPVDLGQVMDADANLRVGKLLEMMIRHPGLLLRIRKMIRNNAIAAEAAAAALAAALTQPGPDLPGRW